MARRRNIERIIAIVRKIVGKRYFRVQESRRPTKPKQPPSLPYSKPEFERFIPKLIRPQPGPPAGTIDIADLVRMNQRDAEDYNVPSGDNWAQAWDLMPTGDMTDNMIETALNMIRDQLETEDWQDILEQMADFWDWYREHYDE